MFEQSPSRQLQTVERLVEVLPRFGCSGLLLHVSWHVDGSLWIPEDHEAVWEDCRELLGGLPGVVGLALSEAAQLHPHSTQPVEVFPRVAAHFRERLEAGEDPHRLELSGAQLLALLDEHHQRPGMFVRLVYDLRGHVRYTRCQPRLESVKRSGHKRHIPAADLLDAAELYLAMREHNGGRNPAASKSFNIPRRTPAELVEHRERQAAQRRARENREHLKHLERRRAYRRAQEEHARRRRRALSGLYRRHRAALERRRAACKPRTGTNYRAPRRRPVHGHAVSVTARPELIGHARPPPIGKPRGW